MSSNLCWEPARRNQRPLSDALKWKLQKRYGGTVSNQILNVVDIPYFEGLRDAGVEDAQEILDQIEKHGEIVLDEKF